MDSTVFFPARGDSFRRQVARTVCAGCPVRAECLADSLDREYGPLPGVWAGLTQHDREMLARRRRAS